MVAIREMDYRGIVESLQAYNLRKNIKDQLAIINPLLAKKENDIKVHLEGALGSGLITKDELEFLEIKMLLGRMCLELEEVLDGIRVTMMFYDQERNLIFHGACPSIPVEFFDFFKMINEKGMFNEECASCGKAVFTHEVVKTDIGTDPLWSNFKEYVFKYNFKSCTSIPFFTSTGQLAGTFAHYSNKPHHTLTKFEVEMIQEKASMFSDEIYQISNSLDRYTKPGEIELTL